MRKITLVLLLVLLVSTSSAGARSAVWAHPDARSLTQGGDKEPGDDDAAEIGTIPIDQLGGVTGPVAALSPQVATVTAGLPLMNEVEPNNARAQATPLGGSQAVVLAHIYPNADEDFFSFSAPAGSRVYVATQTSFSANGSTDSEIEIQDAAGVVLEPDSHDGSFGGLSSSIAGTAIPAAGTYYIRVRHFSATGQLRPYYLHFRLQSGLPAAELEPNNIISTATPLPASGWVAGTVSPVADVDFYSLSLNAGDTVFLSLDLDPERDTVTWNGRLGLGSFGGLILVTSDANITSPNSEAFFLTVKETGTYYAFVDSTVVGTGDATFTYHLSASVHPAAISAGTCTTYTNSATTPIPDAGSVTSSIVVPGGPRIADLNVSLNLTHAWMPDVDAMLQGPGGNLVGLFTDVGSSAMTQMDLVLDDEAGLPIGSFPVMSGIRYQPELAHRLTWFDGQNAGGTWTLTLFDDAASNVGTLNSWSITICEPVAPTACPAGTAPVVIYSSDFETNDGGFTHSGIADEWERGLPSAAPLTSCNSGTNCWKTDLDATYNASSSQDLQSSAIALTDPLLVGPVTMTWAQQYQMESASFDHAYVDIRHPDGASPTRLWEWLDATMTLSVATPTVTYPEAAGWGTHSRDISGYLGQTVELLFHVDSDSTVQMGGLAIDDVTVKACAIPPAPAITVAKTVGLNPAVCAAADAITLPVGGGNVTYCYKVENTGNVMLDRHTLEDSKLGTILLNFPYSLAPGASAFLTSTATITQTTANTAVWTAEKADAVPPVSASAQDTATVVVSTKVYLPLVLLNR